MMAERRQTDSAEWKPEAVRLVTAHGDGVAEAARNRRACGPVRERWSARRPTCEVAPGWLLIGFPELTNSATRPMPWVGSPLTFVVRQRHWMLHLQKTPGHYGISRMLTAGRNQIGLSERQIEYCLGAWTVLRPDSPLELDTSEAKQQSSRTRFNEEQDKVFLGADTLPGEGVNATSRMSTLACLAHELAHAERFRLGYRRPTDLPDVLLDEAETSLRASFTSVLRMKDRVDLVEDARDRLIQ
jgi:hypothetical protein